MNVRIMHRMKFPSLVLYSVNLLFMLILSVNIACAERVTFNVKNSGVLTHQKYDDFGIAYAKAIHDSDINKLANMFDMKAFAYKTARTVYDSEKDVKAFVKGFLKRKEQDFLTLVFSSVFRADTNVKYLRLLKGKRPLIRIDYQEGGHEYAVLETRISPDNTLSVNDMMLLSSGRHLSVSLGSASQLLMRPSKSVFKKLFGVSEVDEGMLESFKKIGQLRESRQYQQAYEIIEALPGAIKNSRVMIDNSVQLAQLINDDEYRRQLTRLDRYFGKDETTTFILIDHHFYNKDYNKAQSSIDRLIKRFGADAALFNLKANTFHISNDNVKAEIYSKKAIKFEPEFEGSYWTLVSVLLAKAEYSELIKALNMLENKFGYQFTADNFIQEPYYKAFTKSSEFKGRFK